ncbi:hypothetical protein A4X17_11470 [Plantibacter sp. H53]|nr:hypothetical protein A4X17_11470 [Plantibacter sp. H53]
MFDSLYGADEAEWQTKALGRQLGTYDIGSAIPGPPVDYQLEVLGGRVDDIADSYYSYATVRDGLLVEVPVDRDPNLALLSYSGIWSRIVQASPEPTA